MSRLRGITAGVLLTSVMANAWLGFHIYRQSKILNMQSASYNTFKIYLKAAMKHTDALKNDDPGSKAQKADASIANFELAGAAGVIWGLRTDFAKKGMDIFPVHTALMDSEGN